MDETATEITVPFLVTKEQLESPVIGYNVIELFVKDNCPEQVLPAIKKSFSKENTDAIALINFINSNTIDKLCTVRTSKRKVVIPRGQSVNISCRANTGPIQRTSPAPFEPDELASWPSGLTVHEALTTIKQGKSSIIEIPVLNITQHDTVLPSRLIFGRLHLVRSVTPLEVKLKNEVDVERMGASEMKPESDRQTTMEPSPTGSGECKPPEVYLSGLRPDQQREAIEMLYKKADAFANDDDYIGCIEELQMDIQLTDNQPIQKNYLSIPTFIPRIEVLHRGPAEQKFYSKVEVVVLQ